MKKRKLLTALMVCAAISLQAGAVEYSGKTYENSKGYTGGVFHAATESTEKVIFNNCTFKNNQAETAGAVGNYSPIGVEILNSTFTSNNSTDIDDGGGAIFAGSISSTYVNGSTFTGNTTAAGGGAIATRGSNWYDGSPGKGIVVDNSRAKIDIINSTFTGNKALAENTGNGGAIYNTFYNSQTNEGSATIMGSTFTDNEAIKGGAIYNSKYSDKNSAIVSAVVKNDTFVGNTATDFGGAVYNAADLKLSNSKLTENSAGTVGGAIFNASKGKTVVADTEFNKNNAASAGAVYNSGEFTTQGKTSFTGNYTIKDKAGNSNGSGGAIMNEGTLTLNDSTSFSKNTADNAGGAIYNDGKATINGNASFSANSAYQGGAIANLDGAALSVTGATFKDNIASFVGGAIYNEGSNATIVNTIFDNNEAKNGGAVYAAAAGEVAITSSTLQNNTASELGGAICNANSVLTLTDTSVLNNKAQHGGGIYTNSDIIINAVNKNVVMSGNTASVAGNDMYVDNSATVTLNAAADKSITIASGISGAEGYTMLANGTGSLIVDSAIQNAKIDVQSGTFQLGQNAKLVDSELTMKAGSTFNAINGKIDTSESFAEGDNTRVTFAGGTNIAVDVNAAKRIADNFKDVDLEGKVNLTDVKVLGNTAANNISINLAEAMGIDIENLTISDSLKSATGIKTLTPIRYLQGGISQETGMLTMAPTGNGYKDFNPAVMASPVAAQLGGYLTQLNSYDQAFQNMDMYMLMTKKQREAMKLRNKYAAADSNLIFDPTNNPYDDKAVWVRPYATFENVPLKNGPRVSNVAYGSFFGAESELYDLGNGWDGMFGVYAGYNGSHQAYDGIGIYQNGGTLGLVGMAYKGNFFTGLTVNAGANVGEANTAYGTDNFSMLMAGIANKTGYNIELADGKFIIQPNVQLSYSFVNTFDYTNSAGVHMNSNPLNAIQVEPGVKFIGNLKNGWQPYAGVSVVWNIMDKTNFHANNVSLPELSVKPYVRYGVGVRKTWGDRMTGFFQTYFANGGRNGVGFQTGFRFTLGHEGNGSISNKTPELPKTQVKLSNMK